MEGAEFTFSLSSTESARFSHVTGRLAALRLDVSSAASRCPPEIWWMILREATDCSRPKSYDHSLESVQIVHDELKTESAMVFAARAGTIVIMRKLLLVCRSWRDIVYPFLLKWVLVKSSQGMIKVTTVLGQSFKGRLKGARVHRLEISVSLHSFDVLLAQSLIEACSQLEEFIWVQPDVPLPPLLSWLAKSCGLTIRSVILSSWCGSTADDFALFLMSCKRLEVFKGIVPSGIQSQYLLTHFTASPLGSLRALSWTLTEQNTCWLDLLKVWQPPNLRSMCIDYKWSAPGLEMILCPQFVLFFEMNGQRLLSLEIRLVRVVPDRGMAFILLRLCPNLHEFIFDISCCELTPAVVLHSSLRRVVSRNFFYKIQGRPIYNQTHADRILGAVTRFCQKDQFPSLHSIRFMDIAPYLSKSPVLPFADMVMESGYGVLSIHVVRVGIKNGIRVEDCTGQPIQVGFISRS